MGREQNYDKVSYPNIPEDYVGNSSAVPETQDSRSSMIWVDQSGQGRFNYGHRPYRDVIFTLLFTLLCIAVCGGGVYAALHFNSNFAIDVIKKGNKPWEDPASCPSLTFGSMSHVRPLSDSWNPFRDFSTDAISRFFVPPLIGSLFGGFFIGLMYIWLLKSFPAFMVYSTAVFLVCAPAACGAVVMAVYHVPIYDSHSDRYNWPILIPFLVSIGFAFVFTVMRKHFELTVQILRVSAMALSHNLRLLFVIPVINFVLFLLTLTSLAFSAFAGLNGELSPNPDVPAGTTCGSDDVPCCVWTVESWVPWYISASAFALLWTTALGSQIKSFAVGSTIAQWYFAPVGFSCASVTLSLKHALGPSFGTLCLSSLVLTLVEMLRSFAEQNEREAAESRSAVAELVACCLRMLVDCLASLIEFVNKFATVQAAITGEDFWTSARTVTGILSRHALSAVTVDSLSGWVLTLGVLLLSVLSGIGSYFGLYSIWKRHGIPGFDQSNTQGLVILESAIVAIIVLQILWFTAATILNAVDTVYLCYALDRDSGTVSQSEIFNVYNSIPTKSGAAQGSVSHSNPYMRVSDPHYQPEQSSPATGYPAYVPSY